MRISTYASGRPGRLLLGLTLTAALAGTLAACSGSPAASTASTGPASVPQATTPAATPAATSKAATPPAATGLTGKWDGQYSGSYQGTFILHWRQSGSGSLSGTIHISAPPGTLPIHGRVNGGSIQFGTVGSSAITYSGTVSGNSMSGTWKLQAPSGSGGSAGGPWSASRS
jgi:hypothetical protein